MERLSREDGTSINQFMVTAVAEGISALETALFLRGPEEASGFQGFRPYHEATRREAAAARTMKCQTRAVVIGP